LRTSIGIVIGVLVGVAIIYMPMLIRQSMVPNLTVTGTSDDRQDLAYGGEGAEEDAVPGERLPILVAMVGLGIGIAYTAYHLARGREA